MQSLEQEVRNQLIRQNLAMKNSHVVLWSCLFHLHVSFCAGNRASESKEVTIEGCVQFDLLQVGF
jgi:hypothetical protein